MDQEHDTEDRTPITTTLPEAWFTEGISYNPRDTTPVKAPRDRKVLPVAEFRQRTVDAVSEVIGRQGYRRLVTPRYAQRKRDRYTIIQGPAEGTAEGPAGRNEALLAYSPLFDSSKPLILPRAIYRVSGIEDGETVEIHEGVEAALDTEDMVLRFSCFMQMQMLRGGVSDRAFWKLQRWDFVEAWAAHLEKELGITA